MGGRNDAVKMLTPKKATYKFNANPIKIPIFFFSQKWEKNIPTICMEPWKMQKKNTSTICMEKVQKKCRVAKKDLRKSYKVEGITLPDFTLYYKSTAIKSLWYWCKNRKIDQWNRIGNPEISPSIITRLTSDKGAKNTQCRKDNVCNK